MKFLEARQLFDFKIGTRVPVSAYIKQSLMATFFLLIFFMVWNHFIPLSNQIIFSAVASSTFLTFISTGIYNSLSSKIIGGQLIGVLVGVVLWFAWHSASISFPQFHDEIFILALALSTGIALLLMSVLDFEHPPAAGTAMAFVFNSNQPAATDVLFIIVCAISLGITHNWLKEHFLLKDLN
ncbi:MAG: hypothetical protein COA96_08890 [SAR86 cluster bacterium]|uniref:HPP transmembrane region domain-containing protein n=1 Tax=SAR86 cluster bacterium TaxID=2030880 RepID=A0A2A5AZR6_9GAMM|nr:MAG: hypothetical protein COA96_08890 [SAR86 cluster bacterium]